MTRRKLSLSEHRIRWGRIIDGARISGRKGWEKGLAAVEEAYGEWERRVGADPASRAAPRAVPSRPSGDYPGEGGR